MNDVELVVAAKAGDMVAFMGLVRRYHSALIATAQQITGNAEDAEDIAQEVIIHTYRNLHKLREDGKFRAWFFTICRRESIDYLHRHRKEVQPLEDCAEIPARTPDEESGYWELLSRLPLATREILLARYFYDLSYAEMATIFDSTTEAMRLRCFRARAELRALLEEDEEETRRVLHGVLASVTAGFPLESFLARISGKIAQLPPAPMPPLPPAAPVAPAAGGVQAGLWATAHLAALKFAGVAVIALVVAMVAVPHLPQVHHRRKPHAMAPATPSAIVTALPKLHHPLLPVKPRPPVPSVARRADPAPLRRQAKPHTVNAPPVNIPVKSPPPAPLIAQPAPPAPLPQPAKPHAVAVPPVHVVAPAQPAAAALGDQPQSTPVQWSKASLSGLIAYSPRTPLIAAMEGSTTIALYRPDGTRLRSIELGQAVNALALSPDGMTLASVCRNIIKLWRTSDGACLQTLTGQAGIVRALAFAPDGQTLASASQDRTIKLWRVNDGACLQTLTGHTGFVNCVAFAPDGQTAASGSRDNTIKLWRVRDGACLTTLTGHRQEVDCVAFAPDGQTLASGSFDKTIKLWRLARAPGSNEINGGDCQQTLTEINVVSSVTFAPDGQTLASVNAGRFKLWRLTGDSWSNASGNGTDLQARFGYGTAVRSVAFTPDGQTLVTGSGLGVIAYWRLSKTADSNEVNAAASPQTITGNATLVRSVAFSPDGQTLASSSENGTVTLWRASDGACLRTLTHADNPYPVTCLAFSPDGRTLATGGTDKTIKLWYVKVGEASYGARLCILVGHRNVITSLAFAPDGQTLASGSADRTIKLWRVRDGACLQTLSGQTSSVLSVAFAPDGQTLASGSGYPTDEIKLWRLSKASGSNETYDDPCLHTSTVAHTLQIDSMAFTPDGQMLAAACGDRTVKLWRASDGVCLHTFTGYKALVESVAFAPDGLTLATGCSDRTIKLWNLTDCTSSQTLSTNSIAVMSIAFAPDGKWLACGGSNGLALLRLP